MSELKRYRFFRKWKVDASKSTLKTPTSQAYPQLTAAKCENPANNVVVTTVPIRKNAPKELEVLPKSGRGDLWDLAYKKLLAENEPLVRHYEKVLKTAATVSDDSAVDIQEQIQAVLVLKRKQVLQKQWRLQWGNKSIKVRTQIDRIVKIIGVFKEAGSVAANADPLHAGLPWAGICFLLAPILNDSEQGEALLSGLGMITDLVARHRIVDEHLTWERGPHGSDLGPEVDYRKILIKLYTKVLEFQAKAACYLSHGTLTRLARNIPKVDDWRALQSSIVRIEAECREYASLTFALKQQSSLRGLIESLDEQEERLTERISNQNLQQDAALMVTRLISDISVGQDHEDIRTRLGSQYWDSGQWLFTTRQYLDWTNHDSSTTLWLKGPVGVGKSCLTSIVIQNFLANAIDKRVAFFYCSQQHSSSADVLRSLLAQMSYGPDGDLVQPVREWFELQTGVPFRTNKKLHTSVLPHLSRKISSKECVELLGEIIPYTTQTTFIIDALDECHEYYELLCHLKEMQERFSNLKIFVSSRLGIYEKYKFTRRYVIEHFDSSCDMIHFIDCEIHSPARRDQSGMTPAQAKLLRKLLVSKADGMFRWVELQLDVFLSRNNPILHPADVEKKLDQLQTQSSHASLTAVYRDLFSLNTQEQPYRRALAIKALQWVFCTFKPLPIEGLAQAVAFGSDGSTDTVVTGSFLLQVCGSFITVTNSGSVRFAHRSVKEYVMQFLPSEFSLSNAHAQVAETCLSFLLSLDDASKWSMLPTNIHEGAVGLSLTGFELYACFFWASHCENAMTSWSWLRFEHLFDLFDKFVSVRSETVMESKVTVASTAFQKWISLLWRVFQTDSNLEGSMRRRLEDAISDPPTPIFTACIWDFAGEALRMMVREGQTVNLRNYKGKSCLYLACENGLGKIVNTLGRSLTIMDAQHERWGSDLHAAASSGLLTSFMKMLECGAHVNTPAGFYGRTIDAAIRGGNPAIVTHALKAGAEVWLPATAALTRPIKGRSSSVHSTDNSSSETLSEADSVLGDSGQDIVTPLGVPGLCNKDSTPPEHYDLLERLWKASLRRREVLNYWRLANTMTVVDHHSCDELAIAEEASGSLTEMRQESAVLHPLPTGNAQCYYCFRYIDSSGLLLLWRYHVMNDLFPYLCPFADCNLKDKLWGVRSEWETHLNKQHPIPNAQGGNTQRYAFTCNICSRSFHLDELSRKEESQDPVCIFRNSHYADHMERIASSVVKDYGPPLPGRMVRISSTVGEIHPPYSSALSRTQFPRKHPKRRRRRKSRVGIASGHDSWSSGHDEEAMSGWSSESSAGSIL